MVTSEDVEVHWLSFKVRRSIMGKAVVFVGRVCLGLCLGVALVAVEDLVFDNARRWWRSRK